ncbi:amino acid adenylation domain-containing protein, partial [Pseudomonas agarici]|uniref:amino acid adenylation domain-containing protein n=2 Tax=Pseudomonas agarici TaxID=46677 RepID=UPI003F74FE2E
MMDKQVAARIAKRFITLTLDKRTLYLQKMLEEGVSPAHLPIPEVKSSFEALPLSFAQQRQWFLWKLDPQSSAYHIPTALRLRGALDVASLERSFNALIARHESLRTRFVEDQGRTLQVIEPELKLSLSVRQWSGATACDEAIAAFVGEQSQEVFDLTQAPLLRVTLLRLAVDDHVLVLTQHHIVSDGWSMQVMVQELVELYGAFSQGRQVELPVLSIQYADYAIWQRHWMEAGEQARQLEYWKVTLGAAQTVLELPTDHPRPAVQSLRGATLALTLEARLVNGIRQLAQQENVTLFMVLLASFQVLMHRYSGQREILIGVPSANRNRVETERLIGFFVNTQVFKAEVDGTAPFRQLLAACKQSALGAQAHQDLPFEQLVEALQLERSLSHNPLFQVMYNHQSAARQVPRAAAGPASLLDVEVLAWENHTAQLDLTLDTFESADGLSASLTYATDLFSAATVERMARHWQNLLRAVTADPAGRIGELPMLDDSERLQRLEQWNATRTAYPLERTVHSLIEQQASATPDAVALVFAGESLSYRQLDGRANHLAHQLIAQGVGPDVLVGIAVERSLEMVVGLLAILKAGGAYVPLDPEYPEDRLAYMIADSSISLLLTQRRLLARLPLPDTVATLCLDELEADCVCATPPPVALHPENLAYVIYTSGSTGKPKGAANRHSALTNRLCWMQQAYGLGSDDAVLQKTPFSFDVSVWEFFWPLLTGARLVIAEPGDHRDPARLVGLINQQRVTTLHFVPSMLQVFLQDENVALCTGLKRIVCSGEALQVDTQQQVFAKLPDTALYNLYGPTEAAIDVTHWTCREEGRDSVPIGEPIANLQTYVLSHELALVPNGVMGELYLGGEGLARGYHRRAGLTAERFVVSPLGDGQRLYRTGDLVRQRANGIIEYVGRIDHQVKVRGLRIELGEIEARLLEQASVREAVVLAIEGSGGLQLVGYVVPADDSLAGADPQAQGALRDALKLALKGSLPDYMVPAHWLFLAQLPLSPNGKLERKALPKPDVSQLQQTYVAPRNELQRRIATVWQEVLKVERVGLSDNFFELGGDSIISIQVVSRARQAGIRFTPKDLFQHQTVQGLATVAQVGDGGLVIEQGPTVGATPLLPFQRLFFATVTVERHHWNQSVLLKPSRPLDPAQLEQVLRALIVQHDVLRLRFSQEVDRTVSAWTATYRTLREQEAIWQQSPVLHQADAADVAALEQLGEEAQRSLDLGNGPLLRAVLVTMADGSQRLLLVIHHLVVDGVSWRILFEDLQTAYQQLQAGEALALPAKSSAFKRWAERLQAYARDKAQQQVLPYWLEQFQGVVADLPCDRPGAALQNRYADSVQSRLDTTFTQQLLQQAPAAYRTQINDLLLTALARVIGRWTRQASVLVQLEGHGREDLFNDIDLTRTLGWFTSLYPLKLTAQGTPGSAIKAIKEQVRAIPDKGLSFGALRYLGDEAAREALAGLPLPRITFNYLGQFDGSFSEAQGALFVPSGESRGAEQSPEAPLGNWLTVNSQVYAGELSVSWSFSREMFDVQTLQVLADEYVQELKELIAHCCESPAQGVTPSDFPLARLEQAQLDNLDVPAGQIENIYPLSPMQHGLLFHSLYEPHSSHYINQMRLDVEGLDASRFQQAWQAAMDAHDILRSRFVWQGEFAEPMQLVHKHLAVPFTVRDWRAHAQLDLDLEALAQSEQQDFDLSRAPLLRLQLVRTGENRHHLIYTHHHILMDGWSHSQLMGEVLQRYHGQTPIAHPGHYRDYIAWLQRQDVAVSESFWKAQLAPLQEPTRLAGAFVPAGAGGQGDLRQLVDVDTTRQLSEFARQQKITVNTLLQASWLLLLQRYTGLGTVCFGATVSGRPADLKGVEQQIGLFINTLPVIASPCAQQSVGEWLQAVQAGNVALREHEHTPLFDVQRWAGLGNDALFDSLLVFENYPVAEALQQEAADDLLFGRIDNHEQTNYPLTLSVTLSETLSLHYNYAQTHFSDAAVEQISRHLLILLVALSRSAQTPIGELGLLSADERRLQLEAWNANELAYPRELCIHQQIDAQASSQPQAIALTVGAQHWSYEQLNRRANQLAHRLIESGVGPEVRVGVAMSRSAQMVVALLAVLKAGGTYVPLDPDYPAERVAYMLEDSGAKVLLTERELLAGLTVPQAEILVLEATGTAFAEYPAQTPDSAVTAQNLAYVIYTSGSTGQPKGVAITHRNVAALIQWSRQVYSQDDLQGVLASTSICFDLSVWELFVTLARGGSIILARNALELPDLPARDQVRLINTV